MRARHPARQKTLFLGEIKKCGEKRPFSQKTKKMARDMDVFCLPVDAQRLDGGKEPVKKRVALSIFEAEMLSQSVSYDFLPTIDIRKVIYCSFASQF
jgi:hypothetical protein